MRSSTFSWAFYLLVQNSWVCPEQLLDRQQPSRLRSEVILHHPSQRLEAVLMPSPCPDQHETDAGFYRHRSAGFVLTLARNEAGMPACALPFIYLFRIRAALPGEILFTADGTDQT